MVCEYEGCERGRYAKGLCASHWRMQRKGQPLRPLVSHRPRAARVAVCTFEACGKKSFRQNLCSGHYRLRRNGEPLRPLRPWREPIPVGQGTKFEAGYVLLSGYADHPNARPNAQILEHVVVMSSILGRPLIEGENVHHVNGVRDDNRPENLELWKRVQPKGTRVSDAVAYYLEQLRLYRPDAMATLTAEQVALLETPGPGEQVRTGQSK